MNTHEYVFATREGFKSAEKEYKLLEASISAKKKEANKLLDSEKTDLTCVSFHEDLQFLCDRATQLKKYLQNGCLTETSKHQLNKNVIALGSTISVEVNGKQKEKLTIVSTTEINPNLGLISNHSPIGKLLIGRRVGETIGWAKNHYKILNIQ